jgi:hypothetical protein
VNQRAPAVLRDLDVASFDLTIKMRRADAEHAAALRY